eukprot:217864-Pelagomonas_calceolata.AAC.2
MLSLLLLFILSGASVVECGRRRTDAGRLQAIAAAEQKRQHLDSTRDERRARARERILGLPKPCACTCRRKGELKAGGLKAAPPPDFEIHNAIATCCLYQSPAVASVIIGTVSTHAIPLCKRLRALPLFCDPEDHTLPLFVLFSLGGFMHSFTALHSLNEQTPLQH